MIATAAAPRPSATSPRTSRSSAARTRKSTGSIDAVGVASSALTHRSASARVSTGRRPSSPCASRQAAIPSGPHRRSTSASSSAANAPTVRNPSATSDDRSSPSIGTKESGAGAR